ncbi:MAG: hypothetical protein IT162_04790 [Bryobacterales bacterium]|nr:hypothetical protein [Bryobacterales bacterium]
MTRRPFDEAAIYSAWPEWAKWQKRARTATGKAKDKAFTGAVWQDLKDPLLRYFHGNCAYCEVNITGGFWGDVEHYRPKKKVEEAPAHGGYYWLAYTAENLMPSCQLCNQGKGKLNHFPLADESKRARRPADMAKEDPLLLNPYFDDPFEHLEFQPDGYVKGKTAKGTTSIKVYNLNREGLVDQRRKVIQDTEFGLGGRLLTRNFRQFVAELRNGEVEFAAARFAALAAFLEQNGLSIR